MTITYYEVLTEQGEPATPAQAAKYGTMAYGYKTLARAIRECPDGAYVSERHTDGLNDWGGNIVYRPLSH